MGDNQPGQRRSPRQWARQNEIVTFVVATFLFTWAFWAPVLTGIVERDSAAGMVLTLIGAFGPVVGATLTTWLAGRSVRRWFSGMWRWRISPVWYAIALLLPPLALAAAAAAHVATGRASFGIGPEVALAGYPLSVLSIALLGGGQEEWGWRGFALPVLRRRFSALTASAIIALIWSAWHIPLFLIPGTDQDSLPAGHYVVAVLGASVILAWLYEATGGSIIPVMLLHGGFNAIAYYPAGGPSVAVTPLAYGLIIGAYGIVAVAIVLGPFRWRTYQEATPEPEPMPLPERHATSAALR